MGIQVCEEKKIFSIHTPNTTYMMGVAGGAYLGHMYYGRRVEDMDAAYLLRQGTGEEAAHSRQKDKVGWLDSFCFEYPVWGTGDFRDPCLRVRDEGGFRACELHYEGYEILEGKPALAGMPATFAGKEEGQSAQTLVITLRDSVLGLKVLLRYSVFADSDAIIRSVAAVNEGTQKLYLEKILSACLDMDNEDFELLTLHGCWGRERRITPHRVTEGKHIVSSLRGETSHHMQPFMALTTNGTSQKDGSVYAMNFVYSGNFIAETELDHRESVRMSLGIHPDGFEWVLAPGEQFETPEAVLVFSAQGLGAMTRTFHELYRNHLIRSKYLHSKRPILINNWEATYFDFDDDKLAAIAKEAKKLGIEMLVMDDGWFGKRNNDECALGDWQVNEDKLKGGLHSLVERVNAEGLKFGIWFEPEMISPDSDLYRAHPDWAIQVPGRKINMARYQYVLDLTRQEVVDYAYECVAKVLRSANIEYVKWDMNRSLTDIGSAALDSEHMGEFYHRYVLGVYQMQERLLQEFPDLLLENCSGGGGRFDPGMLYYSPQIWTSDDMDPVERLSIQEGTALVYPLSTMGAHVCACPNHSVGRVTPMETRAHVALAGTFGYELDITKLSEEEKEKAAAFNREYHKYNDLIREGDYYRIASYRENGMYDCWQVSDKEQKQCLVTYVQVRYEPERKSRRLKLSGLNPQARYRLEGTEDIYSGEMLMNAGYLQDMIFGDYSSRLLYFKKL